MIQKLPHIHCSKDLSFDLACILAKYPMSEKKYEIFTRHDAKKRFGVMSRHCMSVASKCGVSNDFLDEILKAKRDYKFYKKWHSDNLSSKDKKEFKELMDALRTEQHLRFIEMHLRNLTFKLVELIVKSKTFKEKEWPAE